MSRRIEIELTSARPDGSWTWRAAGAREPKGVLDGSILPAGASVGDVLRADADVMIDGIDIVAVLPPKGSRKEPERLQLLGGDKPFDPVVQTLVPGARPRRDDRDRPPRDRDAPPRDGERRDRRPRPDARQGDRSGPSRERRPRPEGSSTETRERAERAPRPPRERRERPPRPPVPELPQRPKPKRLRPGRTHRSAFLAELPEEHRPVAEQVLRGGIPAVRQALAEQNEQLKAEGKPEIKPGGVLALAENLLPKARAAEWLDRGEAALHDLAELDLRDLRSVVAAAGDPVVARDERTVDVAAKLREGLSQRQEQEYQEWLTDIEAALGVGRSIRALRLSSRPPKAGVRFPPELSARLAQAASAALTADATADRWVAVLEAVAYSPVRTQVLPVSIPATVPDEVKAVATRLAPLLPDIAKQLGIEPPPAGARAPRPPRPQSRKPGPKGKAGPKDAKPTAPGGAKAPPVIPPPPADDAAEATRQGSEPGPKPVDVPATGPADQVPETKTEASPDAPEPQPADAGHAPVEQAPAGEPAEPAPAPQDTGPSDETPGGPASVASDDAST